MCRYIIEHYDDLQEIIIFHHADRYQWHNDDPLYDGRRVLSRLKTEYVLERGYVNLRCVWTLGCPSEIKPWEEEEKSAKRLAAGGEKRAGDYYKAAFEVLFPGEPVPQAVGAPCCAQFAVTADRIRKRPKSDYERYRTWLLETELDGGLSGRVIEFMWHSREAPILIPANHGILMLQDSHIWKARPGLLQCSRMLLQTLWAV